MKQPVLLAVLLVAATFSHACSGSDVILLDHAVRMNRDTLDAMRKGDDDTRNILEHVYGRAKDTNTTRDPGTLRGHVYGVTTMEMPDDCESGADSLNGRKFVMFTDRVHFGKENPPVEYIPLEHVELIGPQVGLDSYWFEVFNDPLNPDGIREVPTIDYLFNPCGCNCTPLDASIPCPPGIICGLECPDRTYRWYFVELKGAYHVYNDIVDVNRTADRDAISYDIAAGIRFRGFFNLLLDDKTDMAHWNLGLHYSSGVPLTNTRDFFEAAEDKPTLMLKLKHQFDRTLCVFPFVYGEGGIAMDGASLDLLDLSLKGSFLCNCEEENAELEQIFNSPAVDISFPLSFGLGVGVDIPVHDRFDISFDLGWRRIAFAETMDLFQSADVPSYRSVSMWVLRGGVTF